MLKTSETYTVGMSEIHTPAPPLQSKQDASSHQFRDRLHLLRQVLRFGLVGGMNTLVDLLALNALLLLFPTTSTLMLLAYNSLAYGLGAVNSFLLNKYWTFRHKQSTNRGELLRFATTTLLGIGWSNAIIWLASNVLHPLLINPTLWANASKVLAIFGTTLISYLGMRLWVFVHKSPQEQTMLHSMIQTPGNISAEHPSSARRRDASSEREQTSMNKNWNMPASNHSLSVILPAYNEEQVIASTVSAVLQVLSAWGMDFEIIVVNDGSTDRTGAVVASLAAVDPRVRLMTHSVNQGYGAALVSGFAVTTKELTFFMDADGQFDIRDLREFFPFIGAYDAVIGYRIDRQDSWMRKLNAWGWKLLIGWVLGVHVRDVDCAFKLLHTEFFRQYPLETRGAMINAELLYQLTRAGYTYKELGVHHLPRRGGRASGARPSVIMRAFRELFMYAHKWHQKEHACSRTEKHECQATKA